MSSFLPNIMVTQAVHDLGLKTTLDQAAAAGEDPRRPRPPVQLPARGRRLGLVGDRREPSVHDRLRGGRPGAGAGRGRQVKPRPSRRAPRGSQQDFAAGSRSWRPTCAPTCSTRWCVAGQARRRRPRTGLRAARQALALRPGAARPGAGTGQGRARRRDRRRAGTAARSRTSSRPGGPPRATRCWISPPTPRPKPPPTR